MIRVALYILLVGVIAFGAAWLADRPGDIVLDWQGWHVETSLMVAAVAVLVTVVALLVLWSLIRWILHGPAAMSGYFRERRQTRGYRALSRGMIAAGAGDARLARHSAREADKLLRNEPLSLLLAAQAAQLSGDRKAAREAFEAMVERPDTELLGLRGLLIEAQRAGDDETARLCVERAAERAPGLGWAANALLEQQTREGNWQAALSTVERKAEHRLIDKKAAKRARAVLMTAQALELEDGAPERALALALEANKLAPELVPAAVVAGRLSAAAGNTRQATRVIEKTWRQSPHPDLAEVYAHARPGDSARDRLKRAKTLLQKMPNNEEGRIAVAVAAIEARDWKEARGTLEPLARARPSQRICMLMADIAEGESGDAGKVREWLSRAVRAPRDPAWTADGYVAAHWAPVSPVTGRLDAFEWKVPVEALAAPDDADTDYDEPAMEAPPPLIEATAARPAAGPPQPAKPTPAKPALSTSAPATSAPATSAPATSGTAKPDPAGAAAPGAIPGATPGAGRPAASVATSKVGASAPSDGKPARPTSATSPASDATVAKAATSASAPGGSAPHVAPAPVTGTAASTPPSAGGATAPQAKTGPEAKLGPDKSGPDKPGPGTPAKTGSAAAEPAKVEPTKAEPTKAEPARTGPAKSSGAAVAAAAEAEPAGDRSAEDHHDTPPVAFDRPPDDPGPLSDDEEAEKPKRRFGLF